MRHAMRRRALLAGSGAVLASPAIRAQAQTAGVALVVGNSKYQWEAPLPNVRRDAPDIAKRLQAYGLRTELVQDAGRDALRRTIDSFVASAKGADFAALYYAGHGASWEKDTYLVPVDTDLSTPSVVQSLIPVPSIANGMNAAANRLLVFDNCRNNPADGWRQKAAQGASVVGSYGQSPDGAPPPPNTLLLYSTAPGRTALDGPAGENSPFAASLLRQLDGPVDLPALPAKLRRDLLIATQGRQVVWDRNTFAQPFAISGPRIAAAAARSGWAGDPSRIVELPNAYAYARQNDLPLAAGLIAHRPAGASPDARKIGAFKFMTNPPQRGPTPQLLVVMSVDEGNTAECIMCGKVLGSYWRFITGKLSGERLEYEPPTGGAHFVFDWRDANGGSVALFPAGGAGGRVTNTTFTRLD